MTVVPLIIPLLIAVFLAINMGASGTAPSFAVPYGANLIRKELIAGLFGAFVLLGALIAGDKVVKTIGGAILPSGEMTMVLVTIILLATSLSMLFANILKVPQSTSQSTVFALAGCALYLQNLQTQKLFFEIIPMWLIAPLVSFTATLIIGHIVFKWKTDEDFARLNNQLIWKLITIACSCYVAFSIGSNNVANISGPVANMISNELSIKTGTNGLIIPLLSIFLIAPWFGIGSSIMGNRVLETTGKKIVDIGILSAIIVSLVTATILLLASVTRGIPTSLVQMNTFAIIAIGLLKAGYKEVIWSRTVMKLFTTWIIAPVIAFAFSQFFMFIADNAGLL